MDSYSGRTAIAYVRVSVVGDRAMRGKLESPDLQRNAIDLWCQTRGVRIVGEFRDLNRSGGTFTRPGLIAAVDQLMAGAADGLVVSESSRAGRNVIGGLNLIEQLEAAGKWIAATDGTLDTSDATRRMATIMFMAQDAHRRERMREASAIIHQRAILEKGIQMGPAPYGYGRAGNGRLEPHPDEAPVVRAIFEMRADRMGWAAIARRLADQGVRQRNGRRLNANMLRRLAGRRVYLGEAAHGHHVLPGAHPAIIDDGLFAAVQRAETVVGSSPQIARVHPESVLRGLVRCAGCRYALKRMRVRTAPPRWKCRTIAGRTATHDCDTPAAIGGLDAEQMERLVIAEFFALAGEQVATQTDIALEIVGLERQLADAEGLLDELSDLDVRRSLGAARWREMTSSARADIDRLSAEMAAARARRATTAGDRRTLEQAWPGMTLAERQQALGNIIKAVMVDAGDEPIARRIHVVPIWEDIELPSRGQRDFVARPWRPGTV